MNKFTNKKIKREKNKRIIFLIVGVILIIISFAFRYEGERTNKNSNKKITDLNSIITSSNNKEDKFAYLNVHSNPYKFAVYDDTTNSYYIVSDDKYLYVVYMSPQDYQKLNKKDIYNHPIRIEGITKTTTEDIKKLAIEAYNGSIQDSEKSLTLADFNNYFGSVYLDMTTKYTTTSTIFSLIFFLLLFFGVIISLTNIVELIGLSISIKKLGIDKIEEIDHEMNAQEAFYYDKASLYLTKNYIISFGRKLKIINYQDILWIYPFEQRTKGIKTGQSIMVLTSDGKTSTVATMAVITKQMKEIYNEIWNTIISKNDQILTGYTKENINAMRQKVKEIKKAKKQK